jgi:hypothetical protein
MSLAYKPRYYCPNCGRLQWFLSWKPIFTNKWRCRKCRRVMTLGAQGIGAANSSYPRYSIRSQTLSLYRALSAAAANRIIIPSLQPSSPSPGCTTRRRAPPCRDGAPP